MYLHFRRCSQMPRSRMNASTGCPRRQPILRVNSALNVAHRTAEEYSRLLMSTGDDWTTTLELIAEINVLRLDVEPLALESAVTSLARGGQWQRAENLYRQLQSRGHSPTIDTTTALVAGLASSQQSQRAVSLLGELSSGDVPGLSPAYNLVVRALARQGHLNDAYDILTRMVKMEAPVEGSTFTCVAACCMTAERTDLADEVLEMRDYL
ncbi:hypothetical protein Vafri_1698 [Volvox africanus]|nr:hypothetical protein Vafri_1698 [Volvox africanus]